MSAGYYKASKPELVALFRLEFYKNKKNWKLGGDKTKKPAPPGRSKKITKTENNENLNKTYYLEVDPVVKGEKNSPLNSAFIHEIPTDKDLQEDAVPPPPTPQPADEECQETMDPVECQKLWVKDQEILQTYHVLPEDGSFIQNLSQEDQSTCDMDISPHPDLIQDKPNTDWTNPDKPTGTDQNDGHSLNQQIGKIWADQTALFNEMVREGTWYIPPPPLPDFIKDKGHIASSDVPDSPFNNQGNVSEGIPQAPSSDCLKMLLCPNEWIKQSNEQKVQNQTQIYDSFSNNPPKSETYKDTDTIKGITHQKGNILGNQAITDPRTNNNCEPKTWNNNKENEKKYNNYYPDNQLNPVLTTSQTPHAIPTPDIRANSERQTSQFQLSMGVFATTPHTTAGPVAWSNPDYNGNIQPDIWPKRDPAPFYNNTNPEAWTDKVNSKNHYESTQSNYNTSSNTWMKYNTKYPPNEWINTALSEDINNWPIHPTSGQPSKTTSGPGNWPLYTEVLTEKAWLEQQNMYHVNKDWCMPAEGAPDVMYEEIGEYMPDQQTQKAQCSIEEVQTAHQVRKNTEKWLRRLLMLYCPNEDAELEEEVHNKSIEFIREAHEVPHSSENDPNESRDCVCSFVSPSSLPALPSQLLSAAIRHATKSLHAVLKEQLIRDQLRARTLKNIQEFPTRDIETFPELKDGSHLPHCTAELQTEADGRIKIAMGRPYRMPNAN